MTVRILVGEALEQLRTLPSESVHCVVTSPPYWGLRDYGVEGQLGLESTPDEYVARLVAIFRDVRRVLVDDGTLWLNLGDTYAQAGGPGWQGKNGQRADRRFTAVRDTVGMREIGRRPPAGLKEKDLVGIPWRVAFALQADGWYLRADIIWHKPNPMPESTRDRPTKAHEYLFLLAKSERYYFDAAAIAEPAVSAGEARWAGTTNGLHSGVSHAGAGESTRRFGRSGNKERKFGDERGRPDSHIGGSIPWEGATRNARSVWTITTKPFAGAHFAVMPVELAQRCIRAGSKPGDTILDPFGGAGTTGLAADGLAREAVLIELNPEFAAMADRRVHDTPLLRGAP